MIGLFQSTFWRGIKVLFGGIIFVLSAIVCPFVVCIALGYVASLQTGYCPNLIVGSCIVLAMVIGHFILYLFSRSFYDQNEVCKNGHVDSDNNASWVKSERERDEIEKFRQYLEEQHNGQERDIVVDYRFPNGRYADAVILSTDGQYPIMCFEFVLSKDKVDICTEKLFNMMRDYRKQLDLFVVQKTEGGYKLFKVVGPTNYHIVGSVTRLDYNAADKRKDVLFQAAKNRKLNYPVWFMVLSVTPIVEAMILLSCLHKTVLVAWIPLSFWIVSLFAIMGVGIKGYVPSFEELS